MGLTSSITMPSMVGIVGHSPALDEKLWCWFDCLLLAGLHVAQLCRYCIYLVVQKWVFCPTGVTDCRDKRDIWHGEQSAPPCQISHLSQQKCGNKALKLLKFQILAINLPLRGRLICTICTRLWVDFKFLIWLLWGDSRQL